MTQSTATPARSRRASDSATQATQATPAPDTAAQWLVQCSRPAGFRRAGRAWRSSTLVPQDALSEQQWQMLRQDPAFTVSRVTRKGEADTADEAAAATAEGAAEGAAHD